MASPTEALPEYTVPERSLLILLEAEKGSLRTRHLQTWIEGAREKGARAWLLPCDFERGGVWAGLRELVRDVVPTIEREDPDLLEKHAGELSLVSPTLRHRISGIQRSLTDTAASGEKVRNYPRDRAYRIIQGIIDFLANWQERSPAPSWVMVCEDYSQAGELVQFFFRELMRRKGAALRLTLVLVSEAHHEEALSGSFQGDFDRLRLVQRYPAEEEPKVDPKQMATIAANLEKELDGDWLEREERLTEVLYHWLRSDTPERARTWQGYAFAYCHHYGFYQAALNYSRVVLEHLDYILETNHNFRRWDLVGTICDDYLAVGEPEMALDIIHREAIGKVREPDDRLRIYYALALIHSRFLKPPNYGAAESYIEKALEVLADPELTAEERIFLRVFTLNGLAFIRHRQGRPQEAVELCRTGYELLEKNLAPERHQLHRSVLLYNIGQVYFALGMFDEALPYYSSAIELDPNYSEYYNERGNIYLRLGRYGEAVHDYHEAIRLSPPYQEVWTNLGQVHKLNGSLAESVEAYSHALDLDPGALLPRLGRAQAYEDLSQVDALADYTVALQLDPNQPLVLANRACLLFEAGHPEQALADIDRAVSLEPQNPDLLENRAFLREHLGRLREALDDVRSLQDVNPEVVNSGELDERGGGLHAAEINAMAHHHMADGGEGLG